MQPYFNKAFITKAGLLFHLILLTCYVVVGQPLQYENSNNLKVPPMDITNIIINLKVYEDSLVKGSSEIFHARANRSETYLLGGTYDKEDETIRFDVFQGTATISGTFGTFESIAIGEHILKLDSLKNTVKLRRKKIERWDGTLNDIPVTVLITTKKSRRSLNIPAKDTIDLNIQRDFHIAKAIEVNGQERDSIKIEIFDNARIDNDIVSVYLNDSLILHMQRISETPIVFYVRLDDSNPNMVIKLAAESYGQMPPCTASMIVTTSYKKYTFDLNSTYDNNAAFELTLK